MKNKLIYSTMLVELDTLFDTRLSMLQHIDPKILRAALEGNYFDRDIDEFPGLAFEEFRVLYAKRDKRILTHTIITPISLMMREFVTDTLAHIAVTPFNMQPKIVVNTHPYVLNQVETQTILNGVKAIVNNLCDVEIVHMEYHDLNVKYVKQHVSMMALYEYYRWLEVNSETESFRDTTCPEVSLLAPGIYFQRPTPVDGDPFQAMMALSTMFIGLKFLTIDSFCYIRKQDVL